MRKNDIKNNICGDRGYYRHVDFCDEWLGATIKKLPLWGEQDENSDNYF